MAIAHRAVAAARPQQKYVPAFTVLKLDGDYQKVVAKMVPIGDKKDKNGNFKHKLEYETVTVPRGYLVASPRNGSVHIASLDDLEKYGFTDTEVPLVDDDGEHVGSIPNNMRRAKSNKEVATHA